MKALKEIGTRRDGTRLVLDNILFATDFSPASKVGLRYALALARHYQGKIYMVPAVAMDSVDAIADDTRQRAWHESRTRAMDWIAELQLSGQLDGVRHELPVGE